MATSMPLGHAPGASRRAAWLRAAAAGCSVRLPCSINVSKLLLLLGEAAIAAGLLVGVSIKMQSSWRLGNSAAPLPPCSKPPRCLLASAPPALPAAQLSNSSPAPPRRHSFLGFATCCGLHICCCCCCCPLGPAALVSTIVLVSLTFDARKIEGLLMWVQDNPHQGSVLFLVRAGGGAASQLCSVGATRAVAASLQR